MNRLDDPMEISEEERRQCLARVYGILLEAAARRRARLAREAEAAAQLEESTITRA